MRNLAINDVSNRVPARRDIENRPRMRGRIEYRAADYGSDDGPVKVLSRRAEGWGPKFAWQLGAPTQNRRALPKQNRDYSRDSKNVTVYGRALGRLYVSFTMCETSHTDLAEPVRYNCRNWALLYHTHVSGREQEGPMTIRLFNRRAAASYAIKYAFHYNPDWPSDKGLGGDCTNFVSQALLAGGLNMVQRPGGNKRDFLSWYSGKAGCDIREDRSFTWASAYQFSVFLTLGGRARRCQMRELALGDVVQLKDFNAIHHTMIVTGILPDSLKRLIAFVTYHTSDVNQKPLTTISAKEIMCWKILDVFEGDAIISPPWDGRD
jgi:hypothetical protein